ncbi:hypothetical protein [Collimonas sp. PA-H2]|uniref:hypothetical protein n=1 Tax=Collimonas sp. PA-H2 TaxID=1881062 RepID=UPI00117F8271|nr:hypothetical protein [Collimonas sp. PA-H2]
MMMLVLEDRFSRHPASCAFAKAGYYLFATDAASAGGSGLIWRGWQTAQGTCTARNGSLLDRGYQGLGSAGVLTKENFSTSAQPLFSSRCVTNCPASGVDSIESTRAWRLSNREFLNIEAAPVNTH